MITLHTSSTEIKKIKELITYKFKHTYLNKNIEEPIIDEAKLTALSIIVNNTSLPEDVKKQYIIATMLVQAALDTHDLVPVENHDAEDEAEITSKQLTVLSGDYYSGLYYLLLAEIEDVNMIKVLALAIKDITEYKMKLYYREVDSFADYISIIEKIETLLITRVAEFVNNSIINNITGNLIITSKLVEEKRYFPSQGQSPILDNWFTFSHGHSYSSILLAVEETIETNISQIEEFLLQPTLRISVFKTQFQHLLDKFIYNNISVAEEG